MEMSLSRQIRHRMISSFPANIRSLPPNRCHVIMHNRRRRHPPCIAIAIATKYYSIYYY
jgi:hypothetical protein